MKGTMLLVAVLGSSSLWLSNASAQETNTAKDTSWHWLLSPYFLAPHMNGTETIRGVTADVDVSPDEIFEHLKFGAMLYTETHNDQWAIGLDAMYMNLGEDGTTFFGDVEARMKQTGIMLEGFRRISPFAEPMIGVTYNNLKGSLKGSGPLGVDVEESKTWVDPYVGVRFSTPGSGHWNASILAMIGGFGVGSDVAWQVYPKVVYRFSPKFGMGLAYRALAMDYTTGTGNQEFRYDLTTFGPQLGLEFRF
jgi:hypothetical protein